MSNISDNKPSRLNIRVSDHEKDVITRAASTLNTTVSHFILSRAYDEAQAVLADQSKITLCDEKWAEFCDALDAPPRTIASLKKLLSESSVFDD